MEGAIRYVDPQRQVFLLLPLLADQWRQKGGQEAGREGSVLVPWPGSLGFGRIQAAEGLRCRMGRSVLPEELPRGSVLRREGLALGLKLSILNTGTYGQSLEGASELLASIKAC